MPIDVKIPALGESISSGVLSAWKVSEGTYVEIDQPIYELETDKVTQEGLAEVAGVISFLAKEGDEVEIGATIAKIDESAENPSSSASAPKPQAQEPEVEVAATTSGAPPESMDAPSPPLPSQDGICPRSWMRRLNRPPLIPLITLPSGKSWLRLILDPATISGTGKDGQYHERGCACGYKSTEPPPSSGSPLYSR